METPLGFFIKGTLGTTVERCKFACLQVRQVI